MDNRTDYIDCTPECRKEIDLHLQYRKRYGEHITDKSLVFRTTFNRNDQFKAANKIKPFSTIGIKCMVNELLNTTGIRPSVKMTEGMTRHTSNRTNLMEVHGFRKFFDTTCITAGMDSLYTELLMGHDIGLKGRYTKLTSEDLLEGNDKNLGYASVMEHLIICEENRLKRQVETLRIEKSQMDLLSLEIEKLKKAIHTEQEQKENNKKKAFFVLRKPSYEPTTTGNLYLLMSCIVSVFRAIGLNLSSSFLPLDVILL